MDKKTFKNVLKWGLILWFVGYILGFLFFPFVSPDLLGFFITPIGIIITVWILNKFVVNKTVKEAVKTGVVWAVLAIFLDYLFIVKLLKPENGYYKPDVYLYYLMTLTLPAIVFYYRELKKGKQLLIRYKD